MKKRSIYSLICFRQLSLFAVLLLLQQVLPSTVLAQNIPVTGTIKNEKGEPLQGATVSLKGSSTSVVTDEAGKFTIQAPAKGVLSISVIGYAGIEEKINGRQTNIAIVLQEKASQLNDVVVVGYGTQKKADLTGAVVAVTGSELNKRIATDPTSLLQGKMPGLSLVD